jgi:endonuclease I
MRKSMMYIFLILVISFSGFGQIPPGYYDAAAGLNETALQSALHDIIKNHTVVSYSDLYTYFQTTDVKNGNEVWDMYSDVPGGTPPYVYHYNSGDECGNYGSEGACFNREHSWPKSWFGGEVLPMYTDLFHLYPTDGYVNNQRNNYPYGEVSTASWTSMNGSKLGPSGTPGYSGTVFEPIDEYKGDFARTYFYMSTRYYMEDSGWPGSPMTTGSQLKPWALQMLLNWCIQDSVSQKEVDRNNAVYQVQNNRNPFIDHPEFVNEIWGYPVGLNRMKQSVALKLYPNPATHYCRVDIPLNDANRSWVIMIITITGSKLFTDVIRNEGELTVDTRSFPAGIYCVMLKTDQKIWYSRLVKEPE